MLNFLIIPAQLVFGAAHDKGAGFDPDHVQIDRTRQRNGHILTLNRNRGQGHAETTGEIIGIAGYIVTPVCRTAVARGIAPGTSAIDTV